MTQFRIVQHRTNHTVSATAPRVSKIIGIFGGNSVQRTLMLRRVTSVGVERPLSVRRVGGDAEGVHLVRARLPQLHKRGVRVAVPASHAHVPRVPAHPEGARPSAAQHLRRDALDAERGSVEPGPYRRRPARSTDDHLNERNCL